MRPSASVTSAPSGFDDDLLDRAAQPDRHAAVAHLVDEVVDDLAVDEIEDGVARLDQRHRHVERREDRRIFDADDAAADDGQRARQPVEFQHLVAVEDALPSKGTLSGRCGRVPTEISALAKPTSLCSPSSVVRLDACWRRRTAPSRADAAHRVAHELVLQHLDLVVERLVQALRPGRRSRCPA